MSEPGAFNAARKTALATVPTEIPQPLAEIMGPEPDDSVRNAAALFSQWATTWREIGQLKKALQDERETHHSTQAQLTSAREDLERMRADLSRQQSLTEAFQTESMQLQAHLQSLVGSAIHALKTAKNGDVEATA